TVASSIFTYNVGSPQFVYAVRIQGTYSDVTFRHLAFQMMWRGIDPVLHVETGIQRTDSVLLEINPYDAWAIRADRVGKVGATMWVNDVLSQFSLVPDDHPAGFTPSAITLLVPENN